ncbi:DUF1576 domain-containing protein [Hydrogenoanaerobacterium sp.]|uniref:DUF1576 domain-containing protein n=1 Tax=Hydrogenoanaerobacterium sp. TaxID=2953763 RepID=UPI002897FA75|nr:DUF1576 domain-containing protein [Hydrogenoanaerobacterium sp.]
MLKEYFHYDSNHPSNFIFITMLIFALILVGFGLLCDIPDKIITGIGDIIKAQAGLITDSIVIGGMGAAFVNAGLVMLISIALLCACKLPFSGISVACLFLMSGFALFGKDIFNIFPILLGVFLFSRYKKEPFSRYVYVALFGTCLSPVVTEMAVIGGDHPLLQLVLVIGVGTLIGFLLPPISSYALRLHQGYNLYNVGFAAGLIGMVLASICKSFGYIFEAHLQWSEGNNLFLGGFLFVLFAAMVLLGWLLNGHSFANFKRIFRHSGRAVADFILLDGYPITLINMGVVGLAGTLYVLLVGGALNGPTIGGIFTICGFGAFGKHLRNILPVMGGVVVSSFLMVWDLQDSSVLLAALFSTALAPIAGQFGWKWGFLAGVVHASVVLNVGTLHGGLNLYNNGFAAGLVCIVLIPLIETFRKEPQA